MGQYSLTTASNLFKIKYGKLSENVYNSANVVLGTVKKDFNFTGKRMDVAVPMSFSGGVGSGILPTANVAAIEDAVITSKKMYAVCQIDRESIKAASANEGAFVELTKFSVQKTVESFMRNMSRALFNDGSGKLGQFSGSATGTASDPILTITAASWKEANWEEKDYVNVNSLSSVFEIAEIDPSTYTVTLSRISGSDDLTAIGAGTHSVYMQNSKDNDPSGLKGVLDATSGSLYTIPVQRRWKAGSQINAAGAGIIPDIMNQSMLEVQRKSGKVPNVIVTSFTQYRKLLNTLEDQKQYIIEPRSPELVGKVSFRGVEFMSSAGPVGVFAERFVEDDRMYFLNKDYISLYHRPDFGWFDDDGSVFLRTTGDAYEARYGGYMEAYIIPSFHGVVTGLAV
jgi:hypothetical protein